MKEENILVDFTRYMEKASMQITPPPGGGGGGTTAAETADHLQTAEVSSGNNMARINATPMSNNTMSPGITNPSSGAPTGAPLKAKALDLSPTPPKG